MNYLVLDNLDENVSLCGGLNISYRVQSTEE